MCWHLARLWNITIRCMKYVMIGYDVQILNFEEQIYLFGLQAIFTHLILYTIALKLMKYLLWII